MSDRAASDMDRILAWVDSPDGIAVAARLADALEAIDAAHDDAIEAGELRTVEIDAARAARINAGDVDASGL